jgi:hypothetical protein
MTEPFPNPFLLTRPPWGRKKLVPDRHALIILDGKQVHLDDIRRPLTGKVAYIAGVRPASFARLCESIHAAHMDFFDLPVADLSALAHNRRLRHLAIRHDTKLRTLRPLSGLRLRSLILEETPRLQDLGPVATLTALTYFRFKGGMTTMNVAQRLDPLARLPKLTDLELKALRVRKGGLRPLAKCPRLRRLDVSNQFAVEDFAWLSVRLPKTHCGMFAPWVRSEVSPGEVMIVGRGKPFLHAKKDRARIVAQEQAFARLRAKAGGGR